MANTNTAQNQRYRQQVTYQMPSSATRSKAKIVVAVKNHYFNLQFSYTDPSTDTKKPLPSGVVVEAFNKDTITEDDLISTNKTNNEGKVRVLIANKGEDIYFRLRFNNSQRYLNVKTGTFSDKPNNSAIFIRMPKYWWSLSRKAENDNFYGYHEDYYGKGDKATDPYHNFILERSLDYAKINYWNDVAGTEKVLPTGIRVGLYNESDELITDGNIDSTGNIYLPILESSPGKLHLGFKPSTSVFINLDTESYEASKTSTSNRYQKLPAFWKTKDRPNGTKMLTKSGMGTSKSAPWEVKLETKRIFLRLEYFNPVSNSKQHLPLKSSDFIKTWESDAPLVNGMDDKIESANAGLGGNIASGQGRYFIAAYDPEAIGGDIYFRSKFNKKVIDFSTNSLISTPTTIHSDKHLPLADKWSTKEQYDATGKSGVYSNHGGFLLGSPSSPVTFDNGVPITIIVKLPLSTSTDYFEAKGFGGHTGIAIEERFYDYGPSQNGPSSLPNIIYSPGKPWWDDHLASDLGLTLDQVNLQHVVDYIKNRLHPKQHVYMIRFFVTQEEAKIIEQFWKDLYASPGTYTPATNQCTTTVIDSLQKAGVLPWKTARSSFTWSPEAFLSDSRKIESTTGYHKGEVSIVKQILHEVVP